MPDRGAVMTALLSLLSRFWPHLISFALGAWVAAAVQEIRIERLQDQHTAFVNQQEALVLESAKAALTKEKAWIKEKEDAQNAAAQREAALKAELSRTRRAADGLRDTLTELRERVSTSSLDACRATADTLAAVLGQCQARVGELAEQADGHASDVQTLTEAWPQ